ncbi:thioredoxin family protein [Haloferula sp.]|uniref:thioredoxin family protein n=1 Tax=Haloferula sp. TaxID=2497595 RepID=UPI00329C6AEE
MRSLVVAGSLLFLVACDRPSEAADEAGSEAVGTQHLTADNFDDFVATRGKLAVVMFHASWCGPCKIQEPIVEEVVAEFGGEAVFGMVNVDSSEHLAKSHGVTGIPDLRIYRNGVMVDAMKGAIPKEQVRNHFAIQVAQLGEANEEAPAGGGEAGAPVSPMGKEWLPPGVEKR